MNYHSFEDDMKQFKIIGIKAIKTYNVSTIVTLILLIIALIATFVYFVLPLQQTFLTAAFIGAMVAGAYNLLMEVLKPERHFHCLFEAPEGDKGWKALYLVSKCIQYKPEENTVVVQFMDEFEDLFEVELKKAIK